VPDIFLTYLCVVDVPESAMKPLSLIYCVQVCSSMSSKGETERLCRQWMTEYICWRTFTQFSRTGNIDDELLSQVVYDWHGTVEKSGNHGYRVLIQFVCKIAEAVQQVSEDHHDNTPASRQTALEEAVDILDYIANAFTRLSDAEQRQLQLCLRHQAVVLPLYKGQHTTAKVHLFFCKY